MKFNKNFFIRTFISFSIVIILVVLSIFIMINHYLNKINIKPNTYIEHSDDKTKNNTVNKNTKKEQIQNIILLGIDETSDKVGRSDCIMILTIDSKNDKLKISSIMRDSYVTIPSLNKKDKINHAYAFGGANLTLKTINENFNLNINNYLCVNFSSFPKIVDKIGKINLDIKADEIEYMNNYIDSLNTLNNTKSLHIKETGLQAVDGTQALAYSRIRYTAGDDFERTHRQRIVLTKIFEKTKSLKLNDYSEVLNELLPLIETNLNKEEIISLSINLISLKNTSIIEKRFPLDEDGKDKIIDGVYYYVFDEERTRDKINEFIFN